jgi:integrase
MMASFRKRNDKWQARIQKKGCPTVSHSFNELSLAKKWAIKMEREIDCGLFNIQHKKTLLKKLLIRYRDDILPLKKNTSPDFYRINKMMTYPISQFYVEDIKSFEVVQFRDALIQEKKSANTVRLYLAILSHVFTIAKTEWGYDNLNHPVLKVRRPRLPQVNDRRLNDDEIKLIMKHSDSKLLSVAIHLSLNTAMRVSEISNLRWAQVLRDRQLIYVTDTKNGCNRFVPINDRVEKILSKLKHKDERVFPINAHSISNAFRRACHRAKIYKASFHTLRHEAISRWFECGLNPIEVATLSGHKSMQVLKHYTHIRPEYLIKKLNKKA